MFVNGPLCLLCFAFIIFFHWFCFPKVLLFLLPNLSAAWFTFSRHTLDLWDSTSNYERRRPIQNWSKQNGKVTWAFNGHKCRHQELKRCRRHSEMARGIQGNGKLGISKNYFFSFTWTNVSSRRLEKESKGKKKIPVMPLHLSFDFVDFVVITLLFLLLVLLLTFSLRISFKIIWINRSIRNMKYGSQKLYNPYFI